MRTRMLLAGLLGLSLAACTTGATQAPSVEPSPEPSATPAVSPSPAPTDGSDVLDVKVTWDGTECTYLGPVVIPDGTTTRFEYTAADGVEPAALIVGAVTPGTTWEMFVERTKGHKASDIPEWVIPVTTVDVRPPEGTMLYVISSEKADQPVGGYFVGCATGPGTDKMYPAELLQIAGS